MHTHEPQAPGWLVVDEPQGLYLADDARPPLPVDLDLRKRFAGKITPAVPPIYDAPAYPIPPVLKAQIDRHLRFDTHLREWSRIEREAFRLPLTPAEKLSLYGRAGFEVKYTQCSSGLITQLSTLAFISGSP